GVDPIVADLGAGHRNDLAVVRGVGEDLLVPSHARVEDDLAVNFPEGAEGPSRVDRAVFQREFGDAHGAPEAPTTSLRRTKGSRFRGWRASRPRLAFRTSISAGQPMRPPVRRMARAA